jgi:hypothetical protein
VVSGILTRHGAPHGFLVGGGKSDVGQVQIIGFKLSHRFMIVAHVDFH